MRSATVRAASWVNDVVCYDANCTGSHACTQCRPFAQQAVCHVAIGVQNKQARLHAEEHSPWSAPLTLECTLGLQQRPLVNPNTHASPRPARRGATSTIHAGGHGGGGSAAQAARREVSRREGTVQVEL